MQKTRWLLVFFTALITYFIGVHYQVQAVIYLCKPLLASSLIFWLLANVGINNKKIQNLTVAALFFSLIGDVLLMFEQSDPFFFIGGLIGFLIAHLCYIVVFSSMIQQFSITHKWWIVAFVGCYYATLLYILFPFLGELKIPVAVYGFVISSMFFYALHFLFNKNKACLFILIGAILFVVSDSILAVNKFYSSFNSAGFFIMLTYAFAQYFIVRGIKSYANNSVNTNQSRS